MGMGDIGPGSSGRGDAHKVPGYPLKRPHTTAVHFENGGGGGERDGNGNGYAMGVKNRGHGNRGSSNGGGRMGGGAMMMGKSSGSNKSLVYQILIMFVLTFLVMETVMQGSILMLIRHLDLSANSPDLFSHAVVVPSSTKDVYGYDVKFVPRIVTMDRLLLSRERGRPSLTELRNEQRPSAVRPLRLALVSL